MLRRGQGGGRARHVRISLRAPEHLGTGDHRPRQWPDRDTLIGRHVQLRREFARWGHEPGGTAERGDGSRSRDRQVVVLDEQWSNRELHAHRRNELGHGSVDRCPGRNGQWLRHRLRPDGRQPDILPERRHSVRVGKPHDLQGAGESDLLSQCPQGHGIASHHSRHRDGALLRQPGIHLGTDPVFFRRWPQRLRLPLGRMGPARAGVEGLRPGTPVRGHGHRREAGPALWWCTGRGPRMELRFQPDGRRPAGS